MQLRHPWPHCSTAGEDPSVQRTAAPREPAGLGILWGAVLCCGWHWECQGVRVAPIAC